MREGVTDKPVLGKVPKADPIPEATEGLVVGPRTAGGFVSKSEIDMNLESGADSASVFGSSFGMRLNVPGFIPLNRLGTAIVASSGFGAPPGENPLRFSVGTGTFVTAGVAKEDEGLSLGAVPFAASSGGVFGLAVADEAGAFPA